MHSQFTSNSHQLVECVISVLEYMKFIDISLAILIWAISWNVEDLVDHKVVVFERTSLITQWPSSTMIAAIFFTKLAERKIAENMTWLRHILGDMRSTLYFDRMISLTDGDLCCEGRCCARHVRVLTIVARLEIFLKEIKS